MPEQYTFQMGGHGLPGYPKPPLSMNDRMHWRVETDIKQALRTQVVSHCQRARIPKGARHVQVQLMYRPPTRNAPDPDNLAKTTKTIADALQPTRPAYFDRKGKARPAVLGYGLIPNDDAKHCARPEAILLPSEGRNRTGWWVTLTVTR